MTDSFISIVGGLMAAIAIIWNIVSAAKSAAEIAALRVQLAAWLRRRSARIIVLGPDMDAAEAFASVLRSDGYLGATYGADVHEEAIVVLVDPTEQMVGMYRGRGCPTLVLSRRRLDCTLGDDLLLSNHEIRLLGDLGVVVSRFG